MFQHNITALRTLFTFQGTLNLPFSTYNSVLNFIYSPRTDTRRTYLVYKPGVQLPGSTFNRFIPGTGYEIICVSNFTITVPSPEYQLPFNVTVYSGTNGNIGQNIITFRKDVAPVPISLYDSFINVVFRIRTSDVPTQYYQNYRPRLNNMAFTTFEPGSSYIVQAKSNFTINSIFPTPTPTTSPTPSPTKTPTCTPTQTPTESPQITPSPTRTLTPTPTLTYTRTPSPTPTVPLFPLANGDLFVLGVYRSSAENRTYIWVRDKDTLEFKKLQVDTGYYSGDPTPVIVYGPAKKLPYIFYILHNQMHVIRYNQAPQTVSNPYGVQDDVIHTLDAGTGFITAKVTIHKNQGVDMVWLCINTTKTGANSTQTFKCINLNTLETFNTITATSTKPTYFLTNTNTLYPAYVYYGVDKKWHFSEYTGSGWRDEVFYASPGGAWPHSSIVNFTFRPETSETFIQYWGYVTGCSNELFRRDGVNNYTRILNICGGQDTYGWRGGIYVDALDGSLYMINIKGFTFPKDPSGIQWCTCTGNTDVRGRISYSGNGSVWTHNTNFLILNQNGFTGVSYLEPKVYPWDRYGNIKWSFNPFARITNSYDSGMYGVRDRTLDPNGNTEFYLDYILNGNVQETTLLDAQLVAGTVQYTFSIASNVYGA